MRIKDVLIWERGKDGGPESKVWGLWLIRIKALFTIAILRFDMGSREAYHSHAFHCISWVLRGALMECMLDGRVVIHTPSLWPVVTRRDTFHKVYGLGERTYVFTLRGPWVDTWKEFVPAQSRMITLTHDRKEVASERA